MSLYLSVDTVTLSICRICHFTISVETVTVFIDRGTMLQMYLKAVTVSHEEAMLQSPQGIYLSIYRSLYR